MRLRRWCGALVLLVMIGSAWGQRASPELATGHRAKPAVRTTHFMAVTANHHATEAAVGVLRDGGSATDAAIAAILVLNVVEPQSSGIGGGGFLLHFDHKRGERTAYDGRERAPAAADETLFIDAEGKPMAFFDAVVGGRSVGVPGLLRMLELAYRDHGRLPWSRLFEPAIRLARGGFPISERLHALLAADRFLRRDPEAKALYYTGTGEARRVGERLKNPALAEVLERVSHEGVDAFYRGRVAQAMVARVQTVSNPGRLSLDDLASYRARRLPALCGSYQRFEVCGMPPPSSGGGTVLEILGILERFRMAELDPASAFSMHLFAEASRVAFADRDAWYGDPDTMPVAPTALLTKAYLRQRAALIDPAQAAQDSVAAGSPGGARRVEAMLVEQPSTTHVSIVDAEGNAVSMTASIENAFGSRTMVSGFLLNNQLTDFSFQFANARGLHPNRPGSHRQPRSSMAPTLVFDAGGQLHAVLGSPGGSHIINYVAQSLVGLLDWNLPPDRAISSAHVSNRNRLTEVEDTPEGRALAATLAEVFDHQVSVKDLTSGLHVIVRDPAGWIGAADPRREGTVGGQ